MQKENPLKENKTCHLLDKAMLRRVLDSSPSEYSLPHTVTSRMQGTNAFNVPCYSAGRP